MKQQNKEVFWYFEWDSDTPSYDPWLDTYCIFCWRDLDQPIMTISLIKKWDTRSFFYRCHKLCYELKTKKEIDIYESSLIDNI